MNDAASSSSQIASSSERNGDDRREDASAVRKLAERRKKNQQMFNLKRRELLDDLLTSLDIVVYAELSTIYYMDCSFLRFMLRVFVQFLVLTPKPSIFPEPPRDRPFLGPILFSNTVCIFLHLWYAAPAAGEASRGYLHGGLAMDFVGQKGPTSKIHLLILDLVVIALQLVQMSTSIVRRRVKESSESASLAAAAAASERAGAQQPGESQDLDAEERGVRRSEEQEEIEMRTLDPSRSPRQHGASSIDADPEAGSSSEHDSLLSRTRPRTDAYIFDAFNSGQIVLADLQIWRNVQEQYRKWRTAPSTQPEQSRRGQAPQTELMRRVLRMRLGTNALRRPL